MANVVTIPKNLTHREELIVISRKEYERLQKHLVETRDALVKISRGEKELLQGKTTVTTESLSELRSSV